MTALEGVMRQLHASAALYSGKDPVPIMQEVGWPQGRSGQVRENSPPPGFDPPTVLAVASRYTDYDTRPTDTILSSS